MQYILEQGLGERAVFLGVRAQDELGALVAVRQDLLDFAVDLHTTICIYKQLTPRAKPSL